MGLIKAFSGAFGGSLADQWKDFIQPPKDMGDHIIVAPGKRDETGRGSNTKGTDNVITNGSLIVVPEGVGALLVENGQYTGVVTEPGGFVFNSDDVNSKSVFTGGGLSDSIIKQSWERFKLGGKPGVEQHVIYVNLKEIAGLRYGTSNPIRYKDGNYNNIMLAVTSFGNYSIKLIDPLSFCKNLAPVDVMMGNRALDINEDEGFTETLFSGLIGSLATALSSFTKGGRSIDDIQNGTVEFAKTIDDVVEENYQWKSKYGLEICSVQPRSLDWDEPSTELVNKFNLGAMMQGNVGNAYAQASIAEGLKAAGSNESGGGGAGMFGIGMAGGMVGGMQQQVASPQVASPQVASPQAVSPQAASPQPAAPPAPVAETPMDKIAKLKQMLDGGLITQDDFDNKKAKILEDM